MLVKVIKLVAICHLLLWQSLVKADAEVAQQNDGTWRSLVEGEVVYRGVHFFDAVNTAANRMGPGIINIYNSGGSGPDTGGLHAIRPRSGQTLDFHGHSVNVEDGEVVVPVYCDRRNNITVQNLHVTGAPRYGIWFRGCSNVLFENITMDLTHHSSVGLGIRVDASSGPAKHLTVRGNIHIQGSKGHGFETYGVDGFTIGDVTVMNSSGSGVLLNNSRNGTVGNIIGVNNNTGGGYASFRVANNNGPNVNVRSVYSRNSGRGVFSVSGSHGTIINYVNIENSTSHGIFLEDARDTHILSGHVAHGRPNCQLVRTRDSSIDVDGCAKVGEPPDDSDNNTIVGRFRIVPVHSNKALDLNQCRSNNGTAIQQWDWLHNDCQIFSITPVDGEWHTLSSLHTPNMVMDVPAWSMENGTKILNWENLGGANQQFRFQKSGSGKWRIINRLSGLCLDISGRSTDNGASLIQWECTPYSSNQQFRLIKH
ncbi:RICIN domain-containing protein [Pleionea sediminis]|uniref:RICIN domain-containing protein n=1 Tax=Pleionea sediminis TaxID=2569479 RepID=UPI001186AF3C|nr:RICIN domain-containing protein [Pleionea sediminis]